MQRLKDKVILVTGGSSGIGRATAIMAAREGAAVVIAGRHADKAVPVIHELCDPGGMAAFVQADVTKASDVEKMVADAVAAFGRLDGAVNNAGIAGALNVCDEMSEAEFDEQILVNLKSVWLCMKYEIAQMRKQGHGSIVNMASAAGLVALPGAVGYCIAKAGVVGLTRTAAMEYVKKNIRINAVAPSFVGTPLTAQLAADYPALVQDAFPFQPIARMGTPEEIASCIIWLLSDDASFAYGSIMSVDGGYTAR
jgi:NAD(P)-dependent dehydrogenase (short-subunit alcohol dehydrogenase family)